MRLAVRLALLVTAATLVAPLAAQADALRCGSRIVVIGDTRGQLQAICGDPGDVTSHRVLQQPVYYLHGHRYFLSSGLVEIVVEEWTYNFGPLKLMRRVRIEDGVITDMETLGYGYNEPAETRR
jgi:hypothetical protein